MSEGLLSIEEVQQYLETDRSGIEVLVRKKKLTAYKIGGTYLRFPKDQVMVLRSVQKSRRVRLQRPSWQARTLDFLRYNGFYFVSAGLLIAILYFTLQ